MHLKRICSVIDELSANINFKIFKLQSLETFRLSQVLDNQSFSEYLVKNSDDQLSLASSTTSNTSLSHKTELEVFKKSKKRCNAE